jgi:hypothetical protein
MEQNFTAILQVISLHDPSLVGRLDRRSFAFRLRHGTFPSHTVGREPALRRSGRPKAQRQQDVSDGRHNRHRNMAKPGAAHDPSAEALSTSVFISLNPLPPMGRMGTEGFAMAGFHKPLAVGLRYAVPVVQ